MSARHDGSGRSAGDGREHSADDTTSSWDFFVSYTDRDPDVGWAEWIAWQLKEDGFRVLIAEWHFVPGTHWPRRMDAAVQNSDHVIAVLSNAYLRSVYGTAEWQSAFRNDPDGAHRKLIPIRIEECDRPGLLGNVVSFDLFGLDAGAARRRLLRKIGAARDGAQLPPREPGFPGKQVEPVGATPIEEPAFPPARDGSTATTPIFSDEHPRAGPLAVVRPASDLHEGVSLARLRGWIRARRRTPIVLGAAGLVAVVVLSSLAFSGHLFGFGDDVCVPTELRVAVNPSIMDALERAPLNDNWVSRFEQQGGACHATHLYVYPVDDLVMANALSVDWGAPGTGEGAEQLDETSFQTIGPDPDVWIPSTFLAVESARNAGSNRLPGATPSLGTSPLVALVPPAAARRLPTPLTAAALAKTLTADASSIGPLALRRPATDAGGGLAALVALYSGLTGKPIHVIGDLQPHRAQLGRLESRTVSTSCSSEDIRAQPPIVTLMPKNLVQVQGCSQSGAVRPVDTPFGRLDYPYVALNDPTSPSPERRRAAGSLLSFLTGDENAKFRKENNRLDAPAGSRPTAPVGPVVAAREQFRPNTDLLIAVDVSASMQTKVASFGNQTRAAVAHGAIDQALRLARSGDRVGLWEFADGHRVVAPFSSAETAEEKSRLLDLLNRRRGPLPPGTALYATIAAGNRSGFPTGAEARPTAARVILLITDGKDEDPPPAVTDAQAAASLNGQQIRVFLLSIGGEACAGKPSTPGALSRPTNLGPRVECLPVTTSASLTAAVDQVSAELWGR